MGWSKPVWTKRRGNAKLRVSPFTRSAGVSYKLGPIVVTSTGRVYLFGARIR